MTKVLDILNERITEKAFNDWLLHQTNGRKYNIYSSIDIRNSGHKLAPVDVNLFPAGFNNLGAKSTELSASILKTKYCGKKFLIVPENHTRNPYYNDNLLKLKEILELAGNKAKIAQNKEIQASKGEVIPTAIITKKNCLIETNCSYVPEIILINNDMISGIPEILLNIKQELIPNVNLGWFNRSKHNYFEIYNEVAKKFCIDFSIDPWLLSTFITKCTKINFHKKEGLECVALGVEKMLKKIQDKYNEYSIESQPYIFIKADNGSYGMGITSVSTAEEVFNLNKNTRKKMKVTKGKYEINEVLLQEGIETIDSHEGNVAETLIYCILDQPVSTIHRHHNTQSNLNNLNVTGAKFSEVKVAKRNKLAYAIISHLSLLATSIELQHYNEQTN